MSYVSTSPSTERIEAAEAFWDSQGISHDGRPWIAAFIGTLGRQFDMETVLQAARILAASDRPIRFVLCGRGDRLEHFRRRAADLGNVVFPGWVDAAAIHVLMRRAAVGLDPLPDRYDFLATINNKAIEYLSAGLPVVSSPNRGVLADLLREHGCGASYDCGDSAALAGVLLRLHDDARARRWMGQRAFALFQEDFVAEKVYRRMEEFLTEIAMSRRTDTVLTRAA